MKYLLTVVLLLASGFAQDWKKAKVVSFDKATSKTSDAVIAANQYGGTLIDTSSEHRTYELVLDDGKTLYFAERKLTSTAQRAPGFTENSDVQFRIEKDNLTAVEDHGREFKMKLVKKRIKG